MTAVVETQRLANIVYNKLRYKMDQGQPANELFHLIGSDTSSQTTVNVLSQISETTTKQAKSLVDLIP